MSVVVVPESRMVLNPAATRQDKTSMVIGDRGTSLASGISMIEAQERLARNVSAIAWQPAKAAIIVAGGAGVGELKDGLLVSVRDTHVQESFPQHRMPPYIIRCIRRIIHLKGIKSLANDVRADICATEVVFEDLPGIAGKDFVASQNELLNRCRETASDDRLSI
jgi:hypothetical protein